MVAFSRFFSRFSWDIVGFSASTLCAVHCAVLPILVVFSSIGGEGLVHNHALENGILFFTAVVGSVSIIPSFRKHHQRLLPLTIFLIGILLILLSRFQNRLILETLITTTGALTVALSHFINWKLCRPFHLKEVSKEL